MNVSSKQVTTPRYKKMSFCVYCGHKLTFMERCKKYRNEKIVCHYCGAALQGDIIMLDGKRIPRKVLVKW